MKQRVTVNDEAHDVDVDPRTTLLSLLREQLSLTGAKVGCDHGQCGACTVHVDGQRVLACLQLVATLRGDVTTIEGIGRDAAPHPMQDAFLRHDAFQCGYCTPGQIMSAIACIDEGAAATRDAIRAGMSGNLCRCAAYENILDAIEDARVEMEGRR